MKVYKKREMFSVGIFLVVVLLAGQSVGDDSEKKSELVVMTLERDLKTDDINRLIQPRAGEDETNPPETGNPEESKTYGYSEDCEPGSDCCYQYTWAGVDKATPTSQTNNTCEYLKAQKGKSMACFDPLVYVKKGEKGPPDWRELLQGARDRPDWKIFCKRGGGRSCMRYRFYFNDKEKALINETKFCGTVTETTSKKGITNGCYKEKTTDGIREICVCDKYLCNVGTPKFPGGALLVVVTLLTLIFSQRTSH